MSVCEPHVTFVDDDDVATPDDTLFEFEDRSLYGMDDKGWRLVGTKKAYSWCGMWASEGCLDYKKHAKNGHGSRIFIKQFKRGCFRRDCKICYTRWVARQSHAAEARISKYSKLNKMSPKHIRIYAGDYDKEKISAITSRIGCIGGVVVYSHFERVGLRFIINPHYDIITFGSIRISDVSSRYNCVVSLMQMNSVLQTLTSVLSDTSLRDRHYTFIWFGMLSYSKLKFQKPAKSQSGCPFCGKDLVSVYPKRDTVVYSGTWQGKFMPKTWKRVRNPSWLELLIIDTCYRVDSAIGFRRTCYRVDAIIGFRRACDAATSLSQYS